MIVQHRNTEYGAAREKCDRAYRCRDDGDVFLSLYALSVRSHCVDSCVDSFFLIDSLAVHWYDLLYVLISVGFVPLTVTIVYQTDYDKIGTKIGRLKNLLFFCADINLTVTSNAVSLYEDVRHCGSLTFLSIEPDNYTLVYTLSGNAKGYKKQARHSGTRFRRFHTAVRNRRVKVRGSAS